MHERVEQARYLKIAIDIANRIYHGHIKSGDKIHGRSTLAGEYNVSPETIRRAVKLLEDMEVVSISKGSGIYVSSREYAHVFIDRFESKETIKTLRKEIIQLMNDKKNIESKIYTKLDSIIDYSDRLKNTNPINPIEVEITGDCKLTGRTIADSKFWQNTGGTIVAVRRDGRLIVSPGPYMVFETGDIILVVGDSDVYMRIHKYMEE